MQRASPIVRAQPQVAAGYGSSADPDEVLNAGQSRADDLEGRGQSIGRYLILRRLGLGGTATVYEAFDSEMARTVAIKVQNEAIGSAYLHLLGHEARTLARLSHPNIVAIFDLGIDRGRPFLAMEHIRGQSMAQWLELRGKKRRTWSEILDVMLQVASGLAAAHDAGLLHRDIKPENILIANDGGVKIVDFGISLLSATNSSQVDEERLAQDTGLRNICDASGTPGYMSPEQERGEPTTPSSDVFSYFATFYRALFDLTPYSSPSLVRVANGSARVQMSSDESQDSSVRASLRAIPRRLRKQVPAWLQHAMERGLSLEPLRRYASLHEFIAEANEFENSERVRRKFWLAGTMCVAVLGGAWLQQRAIAPEDSRCHLGHERWAGVWDDSTKQKHARALAAEMGPDREAWRRIEEILDGYQRNWLEAFGDQCERSRDLGTSGRDFDLKMSCLAQAVHYVEGLTASWGDAEGPSISGALASIQRLPSVEGCAHLRNDSIGSWNHSAQSDDVMALRTRVAGLEGAVQGGAFKKASVDAPQVFEQARTLADFDSMARIHELRGQMARHDLNSTDATFHFQQAHILANAAENPTIAADAIMHQVDVSVYLDRKFEIAAEMLGRARALIRRAGDPEILLSRFFATQALVEWSRGNLHAARGYYQSALEASIACNGPLHAENARYLNNLAMATWGVLDFEQALALQKRSVEINLRTLGEHHPRLILVWSNLSQYYEENGDYHRAFAAGKTSVDLCQEHFGQHSPACSHVEMAFAQFAAKVGHKSLGQGELDALAQEQIRQDVMPMPGEASAILEDAALWAERGWPERAVRLLGKECEKEAIRNHSAQLSGWVAGCAKVALSLGEVERAAELLIVVENDQYARATELFTNVHERERLWIEIETRRAQAANAWTRIRRLMARQVQIYGPHHVQLGPVQLLYSRALRERGEVRAALSYALEAESMMTAATDPDSVARLPFLLELGYAQLAATHLSAAKATFDEALRVFNAREMAPAMVAPLLQGLAEVALQVGDREQVDALAKKIFSLEPSRHEAVLSALAFAKRAELGLAAKDWGLALRGPSGRK
jgi:serine/threonine protein kinase